VDQSDFLEATLYAPITIPPGSNFKDTVALKGSPASATRSTTTKIIAPLANADTLSDMHRLQRRTLARALRAGVKIGWGGLR